MRSRALAAAWVGAAAWATPALAAAQETQEIGEANITWVFVLAIIVLVGFLAFVGFAVVYYLLAVVARNRKFAGDAAAVAVAATTGATTAAPPQPVAAAPAQPAPAQAPAQPAPAAQAPAQSAAPAQPAAPASPPAEKPAAAPAATPSGGVPKIDPNNLPDGVDAVARGRLKKLAVLQERGQAPPQNLIEELKPILEEMSGGSIDVSAATQAPAPAAEEAPAAAQAAEAPPAEAAPAQAETAPAEPAPASEPAPAAEQAEPAAEPAAAPDTHGLPKVDPNNLPDGIDAVTRGRLKKLAILQERGKAPPPDLVESLQPILDQMKGS